MALSLETLQNEQLLYAENVTTLRATIALKYPHASSKERADLLAKAIKQILHTNLSSFEETIKQALIHELLKSAIQKQDFSINAQDVITSYATLNESKETDLTPLTTWLSETTGETLFSEEVVTTFTCLKPLHATLTTPPNRGINNVATHNMIATDLTSNNIATPDLAAQATLTTTLTPPMPDTSNITSSTFANLPYKKVLLIGSTLCVAISTIFLVVNINTRPSEIPIETPSVITTTETPLTFLIPEEDYLMSHLQYKAVNEVALKEWLIGRGSILAEDPYFSTILEAAASYNINPLLMFAITGQEQGFVPKNHKYALQIANNPFNVYGSWEDFNTDIKDTAFIAARTIINLSKGCPSDADPIQWLNQKYAEDPTWHKGVTALLKQLEETAG